MKVMVTKYKTTYTVSSWSCLLRTSNLTQELGYILLMDTLWDECELKHDSTWKITQSSVMSNIWWLTVTENYQETLFAIVSLIHWTYNKFLWYFKKLSLQPVSQLERVDPRLEKVKNTCLKIPVFLQNLINRLC
jgi:hypothetical protein